jgi:Ca2+-binding RTX toxin-like protein
VIGGWAWDLIANKDPRAYYSVYYNVAAGKFVSQFSFSADGGKTEVAQQMAQSASDTLQLIAGMIGGTPLSITATEYGHYEKEFVFNVGGSGRNSFSSIQAALDNGIIRQLKTLNIQAGDPYMKRLIALPSYNSDLKGLFTDLGVAKEYSVHKVDPILYGQAILNVDNADARKYLLDDWRRVQTRAKELTLDALPGDDGSEFIVGSDGSDDINAGVGNDLIYSDRGIDIINGGDGNDLLIIDYSSNLFAGSTNYQGGIFYEFGGYYERYTCSYSNENFDQIRFSDIEQFQITGTNGSDHIVTRDGNDTINGGGGNDTIEGGLGNDVISGGDGNDAIAAGGGSDVINAGAGDDTVANVSGDDIIDGGTGLDTISDLNYASSNSAIILNELGGAATLLGTNIKNIERFGSVILGSGNDKIEFSSRFNNQEINSGQGNDTINAGLGIDIINGGDGNDLLIIDYSSNLFAGSTNYQGGIFYEFGGYYERYTCSYSNENFDQIRFSDIEQFQITGTNGSDHIVTRDGNDTINGGGGNDTIEGGLGNDVISGGDGNDAIAAGGGSDVIIGVKTGSTEPGKNEVDTLTGGEGRDTFILGDATSIFYDDGNTTNAGTSDYAIIADFNPTDDIIQIRRSSSDYL